MRRWILRAAWTVGVLLGVPLAAVLWLYEISDTATGRHAIERLVAFGSGGEVAIHGLGGEIPYHPRAAHIEISDQQGKWLTLDDVAIDWLPSALIHNEAQVASLIVGHASIARMPVSSNPKAKSTFRSNVGQFLIRRADLGPSLTGRPISLTLSGAIDYVSTSNARWNLSVSQIGGRGIYASKGTVDGNTITARLNAREPAGSLLSGVAGLPNLGAVSVDASVDGVRTGETLALVLDAGALSVRANGQLDLVHKLARLDVSARAPQMAPR